MLSGSPSRSRGPGSSSRKKSASCSSKDRSPFGTILIGRWSESACLEVGGGGAEFRVDPAGEQTAAAEAAGRTMLPVVWRNNRRSSAMSLAVLYRSDARFERAFWQIRSSSLGIVSSVCRGGRGSWVVICSMTSTVRITSKWSLAGQQLVENDAQAEDVGSPINPVTFAPGLLGTHVSRRPRQPLPLPKSSSRSARPKSATHGLPEASIRMLAGLMSLWTSPRVWA